MLFLHHALNVAAFVAAGSPWASFAELWAKAGVLEWGAAHFIFVDNVALAAGAAAFVALDAGVARLPGFVVACAVAGLGAALAAYCAARELRLAGAAAQPAARKSE